MRKYWFTLLCLLVSLGWGHAQVSVDILLDQEQFLRDESLVLKVRINNLSGQTLQLGKEADWLRFRIQADDGTDVMRLSEVPVIEPYVLDSAKAAIRQVDVMPYYDLSRPGRYSVTATVRIKQWDQEITSQPRSFDIISGFKLWEQQFGVPALKGPPEVRKYILQQANYLKRLMLYVRLSNATDTQAFRVLPIGPMVSFSRPEALLDKRSNLHVLSQSGAWSFIYVVISPHGTVLLRQRHEYTDTRPVLRSTEDGQVLVHGGIRRITMADIPPPAAETATNNVTAPQQ